MDPTRMKLQTHIYIYAQYNRPNHVCTCNIYFRRNTVYVCWKLYKTSISVNRGSSFEVHFEWQVWDGQLSLFFKSIRLKAFGGWKVDRGTTQLHARILRGQGVQVKNSNRVTVRSSTRATFVLPVQYTCVAISRT